MAKIDGGKELYRAHFPRVLMVVRLFYPWIGGTERQAHKLARALRDRGVDVQLVTGWWFRGTPQQEEIDGIPVYRNLTLWEFFGIKGLRKLGGYLYIASLIFYLWRRRSEYELIHVHGLNYHTFAAVLAGRWSGRKVLSKLANSGRASDIHKMRGDKQLAGARFMLPTALQCHRFVALNKTVVAELTAAGVPAQRIVELVNGVEIAEMPIKPTYALHDPVRLLFVGRLHEQKGLDVLLRALPQLIHARCQASETRPIRLCLLGDGPQRTALQELAAQLGIAEHVDFAGESDRVSEHLQEADVFVLPSRAEGLSNALLEAMACGLPVIASAIPGNVDVVQHGENGLLCTAEDPASLADALGALLADAPLRARLGAAARATVEHCYSLDYVAGRYLQLYRELINEG